MIAEFACAVRCPVGTRRSRRGRTSRIGCQNRHSSGRRLPLKAPSSSQPSPSLAVSGWSSATVSCPRRAVRRPATRMGSVPSCPSCPSSPWMKRFTLSRHKTTMRRSRRRPGTRNGWRSDEHRSPPDRYAASSLGDPARRQGGKGSHGRQVVEKGLVFRLLFVLVFEFIDQYIGKTQFLFEFIGQFELAFVLKFKFQFCSCRHGSFLLPIVNVVSFLAPSYYRY